MDLGQEEGETTLFDLMITMAEADLKLDSVVDDDQDYFVRLFPTAHMCSPTTRTPPSVAPQLTPSIAPSAALCTASSQQNEREQQLNEGDVRRVLCIACNVPYPLLPLSCLIARTCGTPSPLPTRDGYHVETMHRVLEAS